MTIQDLFERYKIARDIEPTTIVNYQSAINVFSRWLASQGLSDIAVADIDYDVLNQFLAAYSKQASEYTVNSKRRILIALVNYFLEPQEQTIASKFVTRRRTRDTRRTTWTPLEVQRLIQFAGYLPGTLANGTKKADYFQRLLSVAWESGARRGDIARITVDDVRSQRPFLFVQNKTRTGVVYRLSEMTTAAILRMPHVASGSRLVFPPWTKTADTRWQLEAISKVCRSVMLAANLSAYDGCLKKLRRSAITRADELKPGTGYRFAGHRSPQTTITSYLDPTRTQAAQVDTIPVRSEL